LHYSWLYPGKWKCLPLQVPTTNEVAMIILGKPGEVGNRDVIVHWRYGGGLQRMNKLTLSYDPL